jgi:hypothetical protein
MTPSGMEFSPFMIVVLILSFFGISFFMGMMIHSALMYENKRGIHRDSWKAWAMSMAAGTGITGWMFYYGYYMNFLR